MTKEEKLEMLYEKLRAFKNMTVESREYFKDEIHALITQIQTIENEA